MVASVSVEADQAVVVREARSRRRWSEAEKRRLVALTFEAGASVAEIARRHGVNDNLLFNWRRRLGHTAMLPAPNAGPTLDFAVVDVVPDASRQGRDNAGLIEIELPGGVRVRVDAEVSEAALKRVLSALKAAA